jgi:hypothetical protein
MVYSAETGFIDACDSKSSGTRIPEQASSATGISVRPYYQRRSDIPHVGNRNILIKQRTMYFLRYITFPSTLPPF